MFWVCSYMCESSENTFEEIPFPWKHDSGRILPPPSPNVAPCSPPIVCMFPLAFLPFLQGDTACSSMSLGGLLGCGHFCKYKFWCSSWCSAFGPLVKDPRIFMGKGIMSSSFENHFSNPIVIGFYYVRSNEHYAVFLLKCFVGEELAAGGPEQIVTM